MHPTFTPSTLTAAQLDAATVGRMSTFDNLVDRIKAAARDGSRPHTLIVAPRGAGKTHTLHVAVHRSLADPATSDSVLPVFIPEDALAIGSYIDLLVEIARSLDDALAESTRDMRRHKDTIGIEQAIVAASAGRMILLAIENLDRVFDSLGAGGQGALRAWVETSTAITIFATSPMLFAGVSSRSYPWYGSFIVETLPDLTVDEGVEMLNRAARRRGDDELASFIESAPGRERLQVIHRLAGGSPRLWHILSDGIDVESLDALVPAVESLLDRLAPYYQQQLWQLPTGEQRLVVELARGWEPRTVSDLAAAVGISNQSAATALGRLASSRWVTSRKAETGDKRASWYDLTEPLLRYHLQYREDRGKPLRLIVEFLRGFYSRERLLNELADARPDSPTERHLQRAVYEEDNWFARGALHEPAILIASLRTWMVDERATFNDIAVILEAVLVAALGISSTRVIPDHLTQIIASAVAAQADIEEPWGKVDAALRSLRLREWSADEDDALSVFEFLCSAQDDQAVFTFDSDCGAVRERRISPPALLLRQFLAWSHKDGEPDMALTVLNDILDDIDGADRVTESDRGFLWYTWITLIPAATAPPTRRTGNADVGWELALALRRGDIQPEDFDSVMAAFTADTQGIVAAIVAMAVRDPRMNITAEFDPWRYVDAELREALSHFTTAPPTKVRPDRESRRIRDLTAHSTIWVTGFRGSPWPAWRSRTASCRP